MLNGLTIVLDLGKTLSKLSLWTNEGALIERQTYTNQATTHHHYKSLDVTGIESWLTSTLREFAKLGTIDSLIPVGHGAGVVLIKNNQLALAPLDYEATPPAEVLNSYRAQRDTFEYTGSPALPDGLNLGTQLHWLESLYPQAFSDATLLPWAQYWAWVLSGVPASEVTSLGCHTDLWNPTTADFSDMAIKRGWAKKFAPVKNAYDVLGFLSPEWAHRTGLPSTLKVYCGIHDSNAALLASRGFPEIAEPESSLLSTGTWFVAMRTPAEVIDLTLLPEQQDCLINVDAFGRPIPSARFMGGREIEVLTEHDHWRIDIKADQTSLLATVPHVVANNSMLLPNFAPGFGPYACSTGCWRNEPSDWTIKRAAICLYAALVANTSLNLIGAKNRILVEGRFKEVDVFIRALASLRPQDAIYVADTHYDVSFGALRLIDPTLKPAGNLTKVSPLEIDLLPYAEQWAREIKCI